MGIFTRTGLCAVLPLLMLANSAAASTAALENSALQAARQWLSDQAASQHWQHAEFTLKLLPLRQRASCQGTPQASVAPGSQPARLYVDVRCDGQPYRFLLRASVSAILPVAARDIPAGQTITPADIRQQRISIAQPQAIARDAANVYGQSSRLALKAGSPFYLQQLEIRPLVTRGMAVDIRAEQDGIAVNMNGIAQEAGRLGEWISVKNTRSGKIIRAQVTASGVVSPEIIRSQVADEDAATP